MIRFILLVFLIFLACMLAAGHSLDQAATKDFPAALGKVAGEIMNAFESARAK